MVWAPRCLTYPHQGHQGRDGVRAVVPRVGHQQLAARLLAHLLGLPVQPAAEKAREREDRQTNGGQRAEASGRVAGGPLAAAGMLMKQAIQARFWHEQRQCTLGGGWRECANNRRAYASLMAMASRDAVRANPRLLRSMAGEGPLGASPGAAATCAASGSEAEARARAGPRVTCTQPAVDYRRNWKST
jgi:hypothetical protein